MVNDNLRALPTVDRILKDFRGRILNFVAQPDFTFGKEQGRKHMSLLKVPRYGSKLMEG